ncbi:hypothetical protein BGZ57DRAFT_743827, partial [Hyaloscypha finlandica]
EAFRTHEKSTGPSHPDTLISLRDLAQILRNVGKSSAAEEILQTTLKELESLLVEKNPESLRFLMASLMMALVDQKKLDAAEELWMRAVALFSKSVSAEENDALIRAFELAHPFPPQSMVMAKLDAAEKLEVQVMETRKTKLGVDHPDTLSSIANLASIYKTQGQWGKAEELDLQVMETSKIKLGANHPDTLHSVANLAVTYRNQGRWDTAKELELQVMETCKAKLGVDHPDTLYSMANLATTYWKQGRWDEAE